MKDFIQEFYYGNIDPQHSTLTPVIYAISFSVKPLPKLNTRVSVGVLNDPVISDAVEYIHNNYASNISVTYLAERYHLEKNVFIRKFYRYTNLTPYCFISSNINPLNQRIIDETIDGKYPSDHYGIEIDIEI